MSLLKNVRDRASIWRRSFSSERSRTQPLGSLQYDTLDEAKDEIRLLTLHRGKSGTPIRCTVRNVPLGEYSIHQEGIYRWSGGGAGWAPPRSSQTIPLTYVDIETPDDPNEWIPLQWHNIGSSLGINASDSQSTPTRTHNDNLPRFFGKRPDMTGLAVVPEFEALSYTWGDAADKTPIDINGFSFPVTRNLLGALKRLRKRDRDRLLWVDAICINQNDLDERSKQVKRMPSIYQRAQRVVVWLGDGTDGSNRAIELLQMLGGKEKDVLKMNGFEIYGDWHGPQFNVGGSVIGRSVSEDREKRRIESLRKLKLANPANFSQRDWQALERFFLQCVYWSRAWIIQEITYARSMKLYCGSQSMGWQTLEHITYNENLRNPKSLQDRYIVARFANLVNDSNVSVLLGQNSATKEWSRALGFEKKGTSLLQLLVDFRSCKSTDPRDKIYALLGLPSISDDMRFHTPNYKLTPTTIFQETTRSIIEYENSLRVLCLEHPGPLPRAHNLPSWCPDWSRSMSSLEFRPLIDVNSDDQMFQSSALSLPMAFGQRVDGGAKREGSANRQLWTGSGMFLRGSEFFGIKDGFPHMTTYEVTAEQAENNVLAVDGIHCGTVMAAFEPVPPTGFDEGSEEWKSSVLRWQDTLGLDNLNEPRGGDPNDLPALADFVFTVCKQNIRSPPAEPGINWPAVLIEKFQVWSGQLEISNAKWAHLHATLENIDALIKANVKGWTFGIAEGSMAMLPERSLEGDVIAVLFGGDVPFVLRPVKLEDSSVEADESRNDTFYELIGTAYVHSGIMSGSAMQLFEAGQKGPMTFKLV